LIFERKILVWVVATVGILAIMSSCRNHSAGEVRSAGERAFRYKCATCHSLPDHSARPDDDWPGFLADHADRAGLTDEQIKLISGHLGNVN